MHHLYGLYQPKIRLSGQISTVTCLFYCRKYSFRETEFQPFERLKCNLKAEIQFIKLIQSIKKAGHRAYLSAKTAFLVDIGLIDGDVMLIHFHNVER
jgi:hypothetical protein